MSLVSPQNVATNTTSITFNFTNTPRGKSLEVSDVDGNYIITVNGEIVQKSAHNGSAVVAIVGGTEEHAHRKDKSESVQYYLNDQQKTAMHQILLAYARVAKYTGTIGSGNNDYLNVVAESAFENYRA